MPRTDLRWHENILKFKNLGCKHITKGQWRGSPAQWQFHFDGGMSTLGSPIYGCGAANKPGDKYLR